MISACCLKNPKRNYRDTVFQNAAATQRSNSYSYELGYIVTHPDFERKGYCKEVIKRFFSEFISLNVYATTRMPAMSYILGQYGFYKTGNIYDGSLELMLYDGEMKTIA